MRKGIGLSFMALAATNTFTIKKQVTYLQAAKAMKPGRLLLCVFLGTAYVAPAQAKGAHIACSASVTERVNGKENNMSKEFKFYLDDTGEQVVDESGPVFLDMKTTLYSDVEVKADVRDGGFFYIPGLPTLFGLPLKESGIVIVNRVGGQFVISASPLDSSGTGSIMGGGSCREATPPAAKF